MIDALLETKLYVPRTRVNIVPRPRLIECLTAGLARKLTLISAPAGYGKTTVVVEWIRSLDRPFAWLSLDSWDNDPFLFLRYLVRALRRIDSGIGQTVEKALQATDPPDLESMLTWMIRELASLPDPFVLVLDDYHAIQEVSIHGVMATFVEHQPRQMNLVLITREDPPLPLARLRVRGEMNEIRAADLQFSRREAASFLNEVMELELSPEEIAMLEVRTEGWIAGLLLAAHSLRTSTDRWSFLRDFAGDDRQIMDYLVDEVLAHLPRETQTFLLKTSVLSGLYAPLCQAVVYGEGSPERCQRILEQLEEANLFLVPRDNRRRFYRYHHLFGEMLQNQLQLKMPTEVGDIHQRASEWYEANGSVSRAIHHALVCEDLGRVLDLIEAHGLAALSQAEVRKVKGWFDSLPEELIRSRPYLCVLFAWTLWLTNYSDPPAAVDDWVKDAERALPVGRPVSKDEDWGKDQEVTAHIQSIRASMAFFRGEDPRMVIDLARQALDLVQERDCWLQSMLCHFISACHVVLGDIESAILFDEHALRYAKACDFDYLVIGIYYDQAVIAIRQGRLQDAEAKCLEGIRFAGRSGKQHSPVTGILHVLRGRIFLERNDLGSAQRMLIEGLGLLSLTGENVIREQGRADLARLYQARGEWSKAAEVIEQIRLGSPWAASFGAALQVLLWLRHARYPPTRRNLAFKWADQHAIELDPETAIPAVIPSCEGDYTLRMISARVLLARAQAMSSTRREDAMQRLLDFLDGQLRIAEDAGWRERVMELAIVKALALEALRDTDGALEALRQALTLGEPEGYVRIFVDEGAVMGRLLHEAASRGMTPEYVGKLLAAFPEEKPMPSVSARAQSRENELVEPLSERELEVLELIAEGFSNREIAEKLCLSHNTVKGHSRNIYGKLGVRNRTQAAAKARVLGLLPLAQPRRSKT